MATATLEKSETESTTIPTRVFVKQFRKNGWLPDGHDGEFRYGGTVEYLTVQNRRGSNVLITGLTPEIQAELEKKLNLPGKSDKMPLGTLSPYNKDFWGKFRIPIPQGGKTLEVAENPWHELEWRVLMAHQEVAKSESDKLHTPFARYVLTSEEQEVEATNKTIQIKSKAYRKFGEMNAEILQNFLRVYGPTFGVRTKTGASTSLSFMEAEVGKIVEEHPERFLEITNDSAFKMKAFIFQCIEKSLVKREGTKYSHFSGDVIGYDLNETIDFLNNKNNGEVYLTLKSRLEA